MSKVRLLASVALMFASLCVCGVLAPASLEAAPTQWPGNGHFYEYFAGPATFASAQAAAGALGGYVATITSSGENAFVYSLLSGPAWLGGDQAGAGYSEPAGGWRWLTAEAFAYTNWGNNCGGSCLAEPNNTANSFGIDLTGNEDHLAMFDSTAGSRAGQWFDIHGANRLGYVVETVVPEPATLLLLGTGLAGLGVTAWRRARRK